MNRVGVWMVAGLVSVSALGLAARSYSTARGQAHQAEATLVRVRGQATELARLQHATALIPTAEHRASDLSPILSVILASQGIPSQALASFSTGGGGVGGGGGGVNTASSRERANLVLNSITLPQLGRVLQAWREAEPLWAITSIELTPMTSSTASAGGGRGSGRGGDPPISASITLEALVGPALNSPTPPTRRHSEPNR